MIDKKSFKKTFALPLEKAGMVKQGQSWYLDGQDTIAVVNLQKSDWSDLYYINIGICLKELNPAASPLEFRYHLDFRAESLFPEQRELLFTSCSLQQSDQELLTELALFIGNQLIPFLHQCSNI